MNTFRPFNTRVTMSLVLAVAAVFAGWGGAAAPAYAVDFSPATLIPVKGMVNNVNAAMSTGLEGVLFTGQVGVKTALVFDDTFGAAPIVIIALDLSGLSGVGSLTKAAYVTGLEPQMVRSFALTDRIDIAFPFSQSGMTNTSQVRNGLATIALNFNSTTGAVTGGSAIISSPAP
jgi:hypothetical protein